jgi:aspartyl-tRNA(Asn)/glutamyl-tRNA(Gln) amidotransferase subunit A
MTSSASELYSLSAAELVRGYRSGSFSPVAVIDAVLARLDAVNPALNAVVTVDRGGARVAAGQAAARWSAGEPLSALDGVPVTIKDNLYAAGLRATWGSRLYEDFVAEEDEAPTARLRAAGMVILGKTNVPEFTLQGYTDNPVFGTTFNPIAPGRTPGGSTGGGAAAVSAGIGPIALGTDGGGSIRRPAAHCGLFGFKPSIGQVARYGGFPQILADFETVGPVARTLEDVRTAFAVLRGHDPGDPRTLAALSEPPRRRTPWRIGFFARIGDSPVDAAISHAAAHFAEHLAAQGCAVQAIDVPFDAARSAAAWGTVATMGLAWHLASMPGWEERATPNTRTLGQVGMARPTGDYLDAVAAAAVCRLEAAQIFGDWDFLLCPATAALAWPAGEPFPTEIDGRAAGPRDHAVFTGWMNVAGVPALSMPIATSSDGGGIGMQLVAAAGRDLELLAAAATLLAS